ILDRLAADEPPDVAVEAAELALHDEEGAGVGDRRFDLQAVADDTIVGEQPGHLSRVVARDLPRIEPVEGLAVVVALFEDRQPREAGLRSLENEELEEPAIFVERRPPFAIVVGDVERMRFAPRAAATIGHARRSAKRRFLQKYQSRKGPKVKQKRLITTSPAIGPLKRAYMP